MKQCFQASEFTPIPLSGPNLDSLRRLRLTRDGIQPKFTVERIQKCLDSEDTLESDDPMALLSNPGGRGHDDMTSRCQEIEVAQQQQQQQQRLPIINNLVIKGRAKFAVRNI